MGLGQFPPEFSAYLIKAPEQILRKLKLKLPLGIHKVKYC